MEGREGKRDMGEPSVCVVEVSPDSEEGTRTDVTLQIRYIFVA